MKITEHFTLEELTKSATATRLGLDNTPTPEAIQALTHLATEVLEPARLAYGLPISVSSGYRSPQLNRHVGGSPTSQHMRGEAVDITATDMRALFRILWRTTPFDQLIWEHGDDQQPQWIHVSYCHGRAPRRQVFRIRRDGSRAPIHI